MFLAQPGWLVLLFLLPLVAAWNIWRARKRRTGLPFSNTAPAQRTPRSFWTQVRWVPSALRYLAMALAIIALARPQEKFTSKQQYAEGVDIILVLDSSTSMRAQDFQPDRFEAARRIVQEFVKGRSTDRLGLVVFAARAFTQAPLTLDYDFLQAMLAQVQIGDIEDGTAIGTAIATAVNRLKESEAKSKVIILLTDGQNNRGEIDPVTAAGIAQTMGVRVYSIGVGTHGMAPFVVETPFGGRQVQMVPVDIDEPTLKTVAATTGGRYFRATNEQALRAIYEEIGELEQTRIESSILTDVEERFALFLWPAFGLVLLEILLRTTRLRRIP